MRNDRELVLRVILVDTMLGWAQTENDIFNLWVMMIMFIVLLVLHYLGRIIGHMSQHSGHTWGQLVSGQGWMGHKWSWRRMMNGVLGANDL